MMVSAMDKVCKLVCSLCITAMVMVHRPCAGNEFQCRQDFSVPADNVCDFTDQCGDNSDEEQCSLYERCDFETGLCNMTLDGGLESGWRRTNGLISLVPYYDHNGNPNAYVLSLSSQETLQPLASLRSIVFLATDSTRICQMRFYYYFGHANGILKVGLQTHYDAPFKDIWQSECILENIWRREVITIKSTQKFEIIIQGAIHEGSRHKEEIAIDDVSFSEGCLPGFGETLPCKDGFHTCNREYILDTSGNFSESVDKHFCSQDCDFEHDTCCWISDASDKHISWVRKEAGDNSSSESGPAKDHSKDSAESHYTWLGADKYSFNTSAFLKSSIYYSTGKNCRFQFCYYIEEDNHLRLHLYTHKEKQVLFETKIPTDNQWITEEVSLPACLNGFQLIFEGTIQMQTGSISLDNLQFFDCGLINSPAPCSPEEFTCPSGVCIARGNVCDHEQDCCNGTDEEPEMCVHFIACDFESGFCGWKSLDTDDFTWKRTAGRTSSEPDLPNHDHTTYSEHGSFIYFDGSLQPDAQLISHLSSPTLKKASAESALCQVRFWYQLSKDSQLSVFTKTSTNEDLQRQSDLRKPSKNQWMKANIVIQTDTGKIQRPFQIILQATLLSLNATVAVDDISITPECVITNASLSPTSQEIIGEENFLTNETSSYCPPGFYPCKDGSCILLNKFCDFTPDCPNGIDEATCSAKCDFEADNCGWFEMISADAFDWIRSSRSDLPADFQKQAPPFDHTYKQPQGHFMFILKNSTSISQVAELRSHRYSQTGSRCTVSFWYYNYGVSVGAAEMQLLVDGLSVPTVLWRIYYNQGNQWLKAFIQLGRISQPFQLSLNKVSLGFYDGVSAIDDISFENCSLPPAVASCKGPDQFWCHDTKACISSLLVCDLVDDCGDGSDEGNCSLELQCNFENGLCNWKQDLHDDFDWTVIQGPTSTLNTGPMKDHTLGTVMGHYLYIESSEPQVFQNQAVLISPVLAPTNTYSNKDCIFRLHYHMFGKHIYSLAIYKRILSNTEGLLLWQTFGNKGNRWIRKTLYISSSYPFQILVKGTVGDGFTGDIGIDDLSFKDCTLFSGALPTLSTVPLETFVPATLPAHNCTDDEFVCRSTGHCLPAIHKCDFRADCSDGSDEFTCAREVCDFESGNTCEWYHPSVTFKNVHAFQWSSGRGISIHPGEENHRPAQDHTMNTEEGLYLYADSSNGEFGHIADIVTPVISLTGPKCKLVFWNHMNGATVGTLQVLIKTDNLTYILWSQTGKQGPQWRRAEVFLGIHSYFQIILRAKRGVSYMGDIAVDDISFEDCSPLLKSERVCSPEEFMCANKYCVPKDSLCDFVNDCADNSDENSHICHTFIGRCNFEFDLCAWEQSQNDDFNWNLRAGSTSTIGKGPATDHTLNNPSGHYIYIESLFPQMRRQIARISSLLISRRSKNCKIILYYQISGINAGPLTIYQITATNHEQVMLTLSGDQGNFWQRKELTLISMEEDYHVTFEGQVGRGEKGHIALDDILFTKECLPSPITFPQEATILPPTGSCPHGYRECRNGKCYKPEQSCDFVDDCGDNTDENECGTSCTFEKGRCGWKNSLADNFDWIVGTGSSQSLRPPRDHTLGDENGQFMYLEATPVGLKGEKAHVKSSKWKESSTTCTMSFWYYISSKATGHIRVLIKTNSILEIWNASENEGEKWKKVELPLGKLRDFEIIFEGIRAKDLGGGAAIDDIEFKNCTLTSEKPGTCPSVTDFVCWNKKCIESHLVCDYKSDCEDSSDESDCSQYTNVNGSCNFETPGKNWTTACGLTQAPGDGFDWALGSNLVMGQNGHLSDHTPGNGRNFLYINSSASREGATARIITTNSFPANLGVCRVRFWFYMHGSRQMGTLKLYIVEEHGLNILMWSSTGNKEKKWTYANVVLSSNDHFRVAFEAEVDSDDLTDIALDDISFIPECAAGGPVPPQSSTCGSGLFSCVYEQQCVPLSARCNGKEDCRDGTDEMTCPSVEPSTVPPRVCLETELQCANQECIPSLLRCDGVPDCQLKEDESNCSINECFNGSLFCESTNTCVPVSQRCDGVTDCIDFSLDESSCSECPLQYCKNGGTCVLQKKVPLCQCKEEWTGNRCHLEMKPLPALNSMVHQNAVWIGLGVGITCLLMNIVVTVLCFLTRKKAAAEKSREVLPNGFVNPLYDEQSTCRKSEPDGNSAVKISVSPWQADQEQSPCGSNGVSSFSNPLYGMKP